MRADDLERLQRALADSARDLIGGTVPSTGREITLEQRFAHLARAALDNVPGADLVGLTMRAGAGGLVSYGQTAPDAVRLDELQVEFREGPCLDAITVAGTPVVAVVDFGAEAGRWPRFAPAAVERGVRSVMSFAMAPRAASPGAVNIYSRRPSAFDETALAIGEAFAAQAGIAVSGARRTTDLQRAVVSRDVIGQAKGILMERHGIGAAEAFDLLVRASRETNIKLYDVARWMAGELDRPPTRHPRLPR